CRARTCWRTPRISTSPARGGPMASWNGRRCCACSTPSRRIPAIRRIGTERMKPAAFEYSRPADIDEACALLAADDGARVIAGGQTLVPLMAMRLARPSRLIDIARIPGLFYVRDEGNDIAIGATTRQHVIESDPVIRAKLPLLARVMPYVGHA